MDKNSKNQNTDMRVRTLNPRGARGDITRKQYKQSLLVINFLVIRGLLFTSRKPHDKSFKGRHQH